VLQPLQELDEALLVRVLRDQYGASGHALEFMPVGEDSWSYRLDDLWVSVRRDLRGHFPEAYETVSRLRELGNESLLAPLAGSDGKAVREVCGHPVVVFPYVLAAPVAVPPGPGELDQVIAVLSRLHRSRPDTDPGVEDYALSFEDDLDRAVDQASATGPDSGPYSTRVRRLIRRNHDRVASLRSELKDLAALCLASDEPRVLTHGEPHPGNILRPVDGGGLLLVDWTELRWGPPERDWYHVISSFGAGPRCRPEFFRYYEIRWWLSEFAEYATWFLGDHVDGEEEPGMWERMTCYFPEVG